MGQYFVLILISVKRSFCISVILHIDFKANNCLLFILNSVSCLCQFIYYRIVLRAGECQIIDG